MTSVSFYDWFAASKVREDTQNVPTTKIILLAIPIESFFVWKIIES